MCCIEATEPAVGASVEPKEIDQVGVDVEERVGKGGVYLMTVAECAYRKELDHR